MRPELARSFCELLPEPAASNIHELLRRVERWCPPPNWSRSDWLREEAAVIKLAICEIVAKSPPELSLAAGSVVSRCTARALTRYRQEWAWSRRFRPITPELEPSELECESLNGDRGVRFAAATPFGEDSIHDRVAEAMESLPARERSLLQQLFFHDRRQADLAMELGISQRAVSKRCHQALQKLRAALSQAPVEPINSPVRPDEKNFKKMPVEVLKNDSQSKYII